MQIDIETLQKYNQLTSPESLIEFLNKLEKLFFKYLMPYKTEEEYIESVVKSIQLWFYSLPKYSKISNKVYLGNGHYELLDENIIKFRETLKNTNLDSQKYLTLKLPEIFGTNDYSNLFNKVTEAKNTLENILLKAYESIELDIKSILAVNSENIYDSFKIWYEALPELNKHTLFENGEEAILKTINLSSKESHQIIDELSMILLGIPPCEFEEDTPYVLTQKFIGTKKIVEMQQDSFKNLKNCYQIWHINNGKKEMINTFSINSSNQYSNLLKREIKNIINEYGYVLSCNQKRQVLINLLDEVGAAKLL